LIVYEKAEKKKRRIYLRFLSWFEKMLVVALNGAYLELRHTSNLMECWNSS